MVADALRYPRGVDGELARVGDRRRGFRAEPHGQDLCQPHRCVLGRGLGENLDASGSRALVYLVDEVAEIPAKPFNFGLLERILR